MFSNTLIYILFLFSYHFYYGISCPLTVETKTSKLLTEAMIRSFDISCILSDVDGTLLPHHNTFSDVTFDAISNIMKAGYPFIPCTGRARRSMVAALGDKFMNLFGDRFDKIPGVYQQGLLVYGKNGELIYEKNLEDDVINLIVNFSETYKIPLLGYSGEEIYCKKRCSQTDKVTDFSDPIPIEIPDGLNTLKSKGISMQKMILVEDDSILSHLRTQVEEELSSHVHITKAVSGLLELLPKGFSKGYGVNILLNHLKIPSEKVLAFGDGENDIEMLSLVKYGVAMENASPKLKDVAPYLTTLSEEHGVARVLNMIYKNKITV